MQHNYLYKAIKELYSYWTCHCSNEEKNLKDRVRETCLRKYPFSVIVCIDGALARIPERYNTFICSALFPQAAISKAFNTSHHKAVTKRYSRCLMPWRATGSRQMFWSGERNPLLTSNNCEMKETVEKALEGIYLSKDRSKNTLSL